MRNLFNDVSENITPALDNKVDISSIGVANGVAGLDSNGLIPSSQLPSYVDDVLEYSSLSNFPKTGVTGKIYVALDTNKTYRWGGSTYTEISESLSLGTTSSTAYRGDWGKQVKTKVGSAVLTTTAQDVSGAVNELNSALSDKAQKKTTIDSYYGTSSTAADTAAKVITVTDNGGNFSLRPGIAIMVKFTAQNTAQNPTFNVNNTGAKSVYYNGAVITTGSLWVGGNTRPARYVYDGTYWVWIGHSLDNNTTYSAMSKAELTTGTATTLRTVRADYLKAGIEELIDGKLPTVPTKLSDLNDDATHRLVTDTEKTTWNGKANASLLTSGNDYFQFGVDSDGNYGYIKVGADTVTPFKTTGTRSTEITVNGTYIAKTDISKDGYESVEVNVPQSTPTFQSKTVTAGTADVTVTPDATYDGLSSVVVQPTPSQTKSVTPSTSAQTITPDSGKLLSSVSVAAIATQTKSATPSTSAQTITPDSGKFLTSVSVAAISTQTKSASSSTSAQTITPDSGKFLTSVSISAITPQRSTGTAATTSGIDSAGPYVYFPYGWWPQANATYGNYTRLTAAQAVAACPKQEKTITASRSAQTVTPDSGKLLSKVTVNKYPDASGTYKASSRGASLDMGATNNYRYVNTNGIPNSNSGTYTPSSNGTALDMGASNSYRYVNTSTVYNLGRKAILSGVEFQFKLTDSSTTISSSSSGCYIRVDGFSKITFKSSVENVSGYNVYWFGDWCNSSKSYTSQAWASQKVSTGTKSYTYNIPSGTYYLNICMAGAGKGKPLKITDITLS